MNKPTVEQVAFIFEVIVRNAQEEGSFRHLIYEHLGFGPEAYSPLYEAGGMHITNGLIDIKHGLIIDNGSEYIQ